MKITILSLLLLSSQIMASTIAIIDSGVDLEHKDLVLKSWINAEEIPENARDDDANGYQDDVNGWNFAEQNNLVIDRSYLGTFTKDPYIFFDIQGKMFFGQATEAEKKWINTKRNDPAFLKEMGIFGNFVHGTHVAGIAANENPDAKILAVKLIPTEVKPFIRAMMLKVKSKSHMAEDIRIRILKVGLKALAEQQMLMLEEIAAYVGAHKADVANGSFGIGFNQAKAITDNFFKILLAREPTQKESDDIAKFFLNALIEGAKDMVAAAPDTLFVFASGNDGTNNDIYPTSPTNVEADNVISVGATYKYEFLAPFSNYGTKTVDIAAPGMLIPSQIPGNEYLNVSGTSQAAPFVAGVAARIKDINPSLKPKDIKQILMGTIDAKKFLANKVKSKGIVNSDRALYAAKLSLSSDIATAVTEANITVSDTTSFSSKVTKSASSLAPLALTPLFK